MKAKHFNMTRIYRISTRLTQANGNQIKGDISQGTLQLFNKLQFFTQILLIHVTIMGKHDGYTEHLIATFFI